MSNRIAHLRQGSGIERRELAAAMDVSERTVYRWERGDVEISDRKKVELARYLLCSVPYLMGWDQPNGDNDGGHAAINNEAEEAA
jgi:transcriptional regulator with XRE-family HTH domain